VRIVDGLVNLAGFVTLITGEGLKYLENGRAQFYALIVFGAVLGLVLLSGITYGDGSRAPPLGDGASAHRPMESTSGSNSPQSYKNYCQDFPALRVCPLKSFIDRIASPFFSTF
jgi:hypothetical protein